MKCNKIFKYNIKNNEFNKKYFNNTFKISCLKFIFKSNESNIIKNIININYDKNCDTLDIKTLEKNKYCNYFVYLNKVKTIIEL